MSSPRTQAGAKRSPTGLASPAAATPPFHAAPAGARSAPAGRTLHLPERFGWWPIRKAKVGRNSRAHFRLRPRRRVRARVVLTLADGATPLAVSSTLRLGRRR